MEKKINNLEIRPGIIILNGNEIRLINDYEFIKKTTSSGYEEAVLKIEIIIDGDVIIKNS